MLLMVAIPVFVLGCGFIEPGTGYFGVTNTVTGLGVVFCNIFFAYGGGAISGLILAYWKHKPVYMFLGCISGYACCSALFDIAAPWQCFVFATLGPWMLHGVKELLTRYGIDDQKIVPLTLCPSIFSVLMAGIIGSGLPSGGVAGATGIYAFQHAHISFGMQCLGVMVTVAISGVSGLILVFTLERTLGLRIERTIEQDGIDTWYWNEWRKSRKMHVPPKSLGNYERPKSVVS
jgi:ammonia channel protein AmtB